jgi:hypothetical protein
MLSVVLRILALSAAATAIHGALAASGDPARPIAWYLVAHGALVLLMLLAWRATRAGARAHGIALGAALVFRLVAASGEPVLSDDVYRYVWDGRVQAHGVNPYRYAPVDPALSHLTDEMSVRINHPEIRTIYPPMAEIAFAALGILGLGPRGFQVVFGLLDFGVVLALARLLAVTGLPRDRVVLYAWNPLAIVESAGSGHVEPLGVLLLVLAAAQVLAGRRSVAGWALGAAIQTKLVPILLVPGYVRRLRFRGTASLALVVVALALPYAWTGPSFGPGLADYASRWEFNALGFAAVRGALDLLDTGRALAPAVARLQASIGDLGLPWDRAYRFVWPEPLARAIVAGLLVAWIAVVIRRGIADPSREALPILGAALLLAPTVHPWYVLWILPFAAAQRSWPWLALAALAPLAYTAGDSDVPWLVRAIEYGPVLALLLGDRRLRGSMAPRGRPWYDPDRGRAA